MPRAFSPWRGWILAVVAVLALCLSRAPEAAGRVVTFRSPDGRTVTAWYVEAGQRPAPAVVLVPMLGGAKEDWQPLADRFADADMSALAVDLPGLHDPGDPRALTGWHTVVGAAVDFLFGRPEVRASSIGLAGASLGANLAAVAAAGDSRIRAMALISPSLDYRGVRIEGPMRQYGSRPALLLASRSDPYAARSVRELADGAPGIRDVHWSDAPAHGMVLLAQEPELARTLVDWFQRTLAVN